MMQASKAKFDQGADYTAIWHLTVPVLNPLLYTSAIGYWKPYTYVLHMHRRFYTKRLLRFKGLEMDRSNHPRSTA